MHEFEHFMREGCLPPAGEAPPLGLPENGPAGEGEASGGDGGGTAGGTASGAFVEDDDLPPDRTLGQKRARCLSRRLAAAPRLTLYEKRELFWLMMA